ncbi:hypothetical protein M970_031400 [Encephalitozoon cuniculi EcunIII-L]|uniref:Uncharacterized protein n=1 Tax=Encephalitozoon cuniculi TaxID=6035 RepID=M1KM52_ENCCN|nr:hypothetical protein ECU03_1450 [Encephalitozoon cuniculi]KMV66508.1 hypothetical protein M970_031400 [Encephalitozoon cuniculi EcunIII-L]UYI28136.1 hypothetical protein J0A71_09g20340 [Encephalitozoon cuniculi]
MKKKLCLGEALSLLAAFQLYLASSYLKDHSMMVFCIESFLSTLIVLMGSAPFAIKGITFKEVVQTQSEYLPLILFALGEYSSWYRGAGMTSLKTGMATRGACYPLSVVLMFMLSRTSKENILRSIGLILIVLMNMYKSIKYSDEGFFDALFGAIYLVFYVVSSVSSDFITVCMTNRNGLAKFLFISSFYICICSFIVLIDFDLGCSDIHMFIERNIQKSILLVGISSLSRVLSAFYIQRFGIVAYNTTKISNYIYFIILRSIGGFEWAWRFEDTLFHLATYLLILFFISSDESREGSLGFVA